MVSGQLNAAGRSGLSVASLLRRHQQFARGCPAVGQSPCPETCLSHTTVPVPPFVSRRHRKQLQQSSGSRFWRGGIRRCNRMVKSPNKARLVNRWGSLQPLMSSLTPTSTLLPTSAATPAVPALSRSPNFNLHDIRKHSRLGSRGSDHGISAEGASDTRPLFVDRNDTCSGEYDSRRASEVYHRGCVGWWRGVRRVFMASISVPPLTHH